MVVFFCGVHAKNHAKIISQEHKNKNKSYCVLNVSRDFGANFAKQKMVVTSRVGRVVCIFVSYM